MTPRAPALVVELRQLAEAGHPEAARLGQAATRLARSCARTAACGALRRRQPGWLLNAWRHARACLCEAQGRPYDGELPVADLKPVPVDIKVNTAPARPTCDRPAPVRCSVGAGGAGMVVRGSSLGTF